ncbi:DNA polymerase eta [Anopheles aquasalis]|uniref:DNA polymerase eta n=1 Tax=Anopheles aquasalis TaxID=42839 RepID=UPI00215AE4FB|nr:DNA polymerase eta [Anopheles aquasalis]
MSSKTNINIKNKFDRVVVLVDMDCFYCQVEEKRNPEISGKPIAVVQYNPWQGGGIIAVNYPARAKGVTRHMRGDEAKQHCPEIELPQVPNVRGKADLTRYREAGKEVAEVLKSFTPLLERASIDEAYLDITERVLSRIRDMNEGRFQLLPDKLANTFAVGYDSIGDFVKKLSNTFDSSGTAEQGTPEQLEYKKSDIKLLVGASIVNEIRSAVKEKTGYECSAGVAHNKILAKLTAGFHKPNKQTILPIDSIAKLYETLPVKKVKGLGGKLGDQVCELLKIKFMSEMVQFPESLLQQHFDERLGSWMYLMARGIDLEAVTAKFHSKSIGCCKRFPGKNAITGLATLQHWLNELATEIVERLEKDLDENNRTAKQMTVSYSQQFGDTDVSSTRSVPLVLYETDRIASDALEAIKRNTERFFKAGSTTALHNAIKFLGISAGKFEPNGATKGAGIKEMFQSCSAKATHTNVGPLDDVKNDRQTADTEASSSVTVVPTIELVPEEAAPVVVQPKAKKDIKHFLQNATKASRSASVDESSLNENKEELNVSETVDSHPTVEPVQVKKDIKHFLQPRGKSTSDDTAITSAKNNLLDTTNEPANSDNSASIVERPDEGNRRSAIPLEYLLAAAEELSSQPVSTDPATVAPESHLSYKETYAEYSFLPPAEQEAVAIATVKCEQCGKQIPEDELLSHQDFHFALQLSQQQREEFRSEFKSKVVTNSGITNTNSKPPAPSAPVTPVVKRQSAATSSTASIARFLSKLPTEPARSSSASARTSADQEKPNEASTSGHQHIKCPDCGKMINQLAMGEHMDYHVAKQLQLELNRTEAMQLQQAPASSQSSGSITTSAKRKRSVANGEESITPPKQKVKPVSSYFSKL